MSEAAVHTYVVDSIEIADRSPPAWWNQTQDRTATLVGCPCGPARQRIIVHRVMAA